MCGRFSQTIDFFKIKEQFDEISNIDFSPNYNYSPGDDIPVLFLSNNKRRLEFIKWGFINEWTLEKKLNLINIRKETLFEKNYFYRFLKNNRCLILADGFYEWRKNGNEKIPYYFHLKDKSLFAFGGIMNIMIQPDNVEVKSCAIITTNPNKIVSEIHNRMPVIIPIENWYIWLNTNDDNILLKLMEPFPEELIEKYRVSKLVNKSKINSPDCIKPIYNIE